VVYLTAPEVTGNLRTADRVVVLFGAPPADS